MKKSILIWLIIIISFMISCDNNLFSQISSTNLSARSLFSDVKAFKIGDAVTILIVEDTQADNSATTQDSRESSLSGGVNAGTGSSSFQGNAGINTGNSFKGSGQTSRSERIRSKLSARVDSVDQNGNLKITGKRTTKVNGETQTIVIQGFVRPVDILSNNSVYSYSILDLNLSIEGDGSVSNIQEPGLITKFLRMLF